MLDTALLIHLGLIKPNEKLMDAMEAQSEATKNLIKVIEKNPEAFDRFMNKLFSQKK